KYPKEKRSKIAEIYLNEPSLEGELDLEDFTYIYDFCYPKNGTCIRKNEKKDHKENIVIDNFVEGNLNLNDFINLEEFDCHANELSSLDLTNCEKLKEINFFRNQIANLILPNNCSTLIRLNCSENNLTSLNVNNCFNLTELDCKDNLLTSIILPTNPTNLKELDLTNNNFNQDLSFLTPYTNLERLDLGNCRSYKSDEITRQKIQQGIYNRFTGSLDYLSGMEKLNDIALKSLTNSQNVILEFLTELVNNNLVNDDGGHVIEQCYTVKCYGISQDPKTKNYVMVTEYMIEGNLRQHLRNKTGKLIEYDKDTEFYQQYLKIEKEYNTFSQNTPYKIHPTATTTSKMIDTREITTRLQTLNLSNPVDLVEIPEEEEQQETSPQAQIQIPPKNN
ncbi:6388_t:CDS:2, partial [Racocetra fulgida]